MIYEHNNFFFNERNEILEVIDIAEKWGYGNLIAHLRYAWAKKLIEQGISKETAIEATNSSPYPI